MILSHRTYEGGSIIGCTKVGRLISFPPESQRENAFDDKGVPLGSEEFC